MRYPLAILVALLPLGAVAQSGGGGPVGAGSAAATGYTPDDGGNWTDPDPTTVGGALDALAAAAAGVITAALQDLDDVGVVGAADRWLYSTGAGTWAYGTVTAAGRAILDDATAGDQRTTLGLGALATGADTTDVPIAACAVDANWDSSICPAAAQTAFDELASRVKTLEGAGGGGRWDWTQEVGSPAAADWTDLTNYNGDAALSTLADCTVGDCVRFVPGASTTDRYGAAVSVGAGDFQRCALFGAVNANVSSFGAVQSGKVGLVFVDGTDVDADKHYGIHTVALSDDMASRLLYVQDSNGGGTDELDAAWTPDVQDAFPGYDIETCFQRSGTDLTIYFSPHGAGWVKAISYTVSAGAGLMAIVIDEDDANVDEAVLYRFGDPGGLPWQ